MRGWGSNRRRRGTRRPSASAIWPTEMMTFTEPVTEEVAATEPVAEEVVVAELVMGEVQEPVESEEEEVEEVAGGLVGVGGMIW
jgi:hypothetical protein